MTQYLTIEEVLRLHYNLIEDYGGSHGVRDEKRLQSVVAAPMQEIFGAEQYKSVYEKAAVYARNIIGDHPFTDGNKRTGITICGVFMARNECYLQALPTALEDFAVSIATEHLTIPNIATWLEKQSSSAPHM